MRPSDVRYGRRQTLTLKALDERSVPLTTLRGSEVLLHRGTSGESLLYLPDRVVKVDGRSAADRDRLQSILDHNPPSLVWLIRVLRDTGGPPDFIIMHLSLAHRQALEEPISIAVGDIALDDIRRRSRLGSATNEALLAWLVDQVVIQGNPLSSLNLDTAASIPASRVIATGLEPDALERGVGFRLHGRDLDVDVGLSDGRLSVIRLAPISGARERTPTLVTASVQIVDWSHAALFRAEGVHELLDILAGDAAYLNLWRQYYEREVAQVNTLAQRIGLARYDRRRVESQPVVYEGVS